MGGFSDESRILPFVNGTPAGHNAGNHGTYNNMESKTYNGWTNYETWAVATWLDSDQATYLYWHEQARRCLEQSPKFDAVLRGTTTAEDAAQYFLSEQLKEETDSAKPDVFTGAYADLLNAALGEVNWDEIADHYLEKPKQAHSSFGPVIFAYTRAQAIADGVLIDAGEMAKEAGFTMSVALTSAVWGEYVRVPEKAEGQDEQGRLWDVLNMLRFAIKQGGRDSQLVFTVYVNNDGEPKPVVLKSICGPGDAAEPVITIMLPHEGASCHDAVDPFRRKEE